MRIFVAGRSTGLLTSSLMRRLPVRTSHEVIDHGTLDLRDRQATLRWFRACHFDAVILAAAQTGGIYANVTQPGMFLHDNLRIQTSVFDAARRTGVQCLLFFGCGCAYPVRAPQPLREDRLGTGPLEPTGQASALAKLTGIAMCAAYNAQYGPAAYIPIIPASLYGPGGNFDLTRSHVLSALIRKCLEATVSGDVVTIWGTGTPKREFIYVDDVADACAWLLNQRLTERSPINLGTGEELTIRALAELVASIVGYRGGFRYDPSKPDGAPRKLLDSTRLSTLGWRPKILLEEGIARTVAWARTAPWACKKEWPCGSS